MFKRLRHIIHNFRIDMATQGTFLGGRVVSIDGRETTYDTVSTGYDIAELIFFKYYPLAPNDVLVDVGSGKGRVLNYLLYKGLKNKLIGYEINPMIAEHTQRNLSKYNNVEIYGRNILDDFPQNASVFYMFNPFKHTMMREFKEKILELRDRKPVILYYNPTCIDVFDDPRFSYQLIDVPLLFFGLPYKLAIIRMK